jgi:hypothetical protein
VAAVSIQQALIRSLGGEELPPPPILGLVLTSGLYPVAFEGDELNVGASLESIVVASFFTDEFLSVSASLQALTLTATIVYTSYTNWPFEQLYATASFQGLTLTNTIVFTSYTNWPFEQLSVSGGLAPGGPGITLTTAIAYVFNTMQPEDLFIGGSLIGVTLA